MSIQSISQNYFNKIHFYFYFEKVITFYHVFIKIVPRTAPALSACLSAKVGILHHSLAHGSFQLRVWFMEVSSFLSTQ